MSSLSLQDIGLKPTQLKTVARRAKEQGKSLPEYVRSLVERDLLAGGSFDEVSSPIRDGFKKEGVTERQLDTLVNHARKDFQARSRRKADK